jgi:uncharacterized protein DUF4129
MKFGSTFGVLALAGSLFIAPVARSQAATSAEAGADQATQLEGSTLRTEAAALDRAAKAGHVPVASEVSLVSPALGPWLAAGLGAARKEKSAAARIADVRSMAASLRIEADLADRAARASQPVHLGDNVHQVLAQPDFRTPVRPGAARPRQQTWLERMLTSLSDWWSRLLVRAFTAAAGVPAIGNFVAFALVAAAAVALAFLIFRIASFVMARRVRRGRINVDGTPLTDHPSADETYSTARAAARDGLYALAIALLFQAALLALDRSGSIPYDSARTAGEYRRAVRRSVAGAAAPFETLVRAFTYAAYAETPAGESDWRAADAAYASMSLSSSGRS